MGRALEQVETAQQLALYRRTVPPRVEARRREQPVCAGCRQKEARYGFRERETGDPLVDRPRTLCFECFRMEISRRQAAAAMLARGWDAKQERLPLEETLESLSQRRRRAQIAARRALDLAGS